MVSSTEYPDLVIVGAGLFGLTVAQQAVEHTGARVHIIERPRPHRRQRLLVTSTRPPASRCTATAPTRSTRRTSACGPTSTASRAFNDYRHRVYADLRGDVYPLPINLGTINQFFGAAYSPAEARAARAAGRRDHGRTGQPEREGASA